MRMCELQVAINNDGIFSVTLQFVRMCELQDLETSIAQTSSLLQFVRMCELQVLETGRRLELRNVAIRAHV